MEKVSPWQRSTGRIDTRANNNTCRRERQKDETPLAKAAGYISISWFFSHVTTLKI